MKHVHMFAGALVALAACTPSDPPQDLAQDSAQASAQAFTSDRISVVTRGAGPAMILVPGLGSHHTVWDSVAGPLEAKYTLHIVQVNGFAGVAPGGNASGPVSAPVAEEIARYITATGLTKPALVGHSMGGSIGMMLAARHPDALGHLIVVDMHPFVGQWLGGPDATPETVRPAADRILVVPDSFVGEFTNMVSGMTNRESLRAGLVQNVNASTQTTVVNSFHELMTTDLRPDLSRITTPMAVLYVVPSDGPVPPAQYEAGMRAAYANAPNAKLVKIDNALHFIQLDQPGRLVAEIEAFVPR
jgi:pimeloyl-ACP methyl ester carboxylesterase